MKQRGLELLAPAGSMEILKAVISAGADAVYVGGNMFGARAYANNFSNEELIEAIDYAHLYGRKLFLTVNTLLKNNEICNLLYDYILPLYLNGLDAVIVQDLGVVRFIKEFFPDLPIHISTQATITGSKGVEFFREYDVERVVLSRELSIPEIKQIYQETNMELEVFVHGALCYCYSGQCLFSSLLGGRSGNRGRCAQPCRLPYLVLEQNNHNILQESYPLSMKDLCGISYLKELYDAGVYSLKIEGRMKSKEYAAGVVSIYRKNIDYLLQSEGQYSILKEDAKKLFDYGNRGGFTTGYLEGTKGPDMITFDKPSYEKDKNHNYNSAVVNSIMVQGKALFKLGQSAMLTIKCNGITIESKGEIVQKAKKVPLQFEDVEARLKKVGDTNFRFHSLEIEMDEEIFLPNGAINQLRRNAINSLLYELLQPFKRTKDSIKSFPSQDSGILGKNLEKDENWIVSIENRNLLPIVLKKAFVQNIYMSCMAYDKTSLIQGLATDIKRIKEAGKNCFFVLPTILRNKSYLYYKNLFHNIALSELDGFVVQNYEALQLVKENYKDYQCIVDYNMYTYNNYAKKAFFSNHVVRDVIPYELNEKEIRQRDNRNSECVVYGYYPLMVSSQCIRRNTLSCDKRRSLLFMKDRYNKRFPVKNCCDDCYNIIYNSVPVLLTNLDSLHKSGICYYRINFTIESEKEAKRILDSFENYNENHIFSLQEERPGQYTKGHFKRGVE